MHLQALHALDGDVGRLAKLAVEGHEVSVPESVATWLSRFEVMVMRAATPRTDTNLVEIDQRALEAMLEALTKSIAESPAAPRLSPEARRRVEDFLRDGATLPKNKTGP